MAGLLLFYFSPYILHLNDTLLSASGDGLKNFYTLAYYVKYDSGFWFTGMLYPYGEHVIFTDNQPLLAFLLGIIQRHFFDVSEYLAGIVNGLLFLNFFLCGFFLYKTLLLLRLPQSYSMLCAILITCISPTIARMPGHFSLSYSSILTATIYLIVLNATTNNNGKRYRIAFFLALISFLSAWLHPYWVIITGMMILSFCFVQFLSEKKISLPLLLAGIAGPLLFKIALLLTDPVVDRPQDPWGARHYAAWTSSVFFPQVEFYDPLRELLHIRKAEWEGIAFVGLAGMFFLVVLAVKIFRKGRKKQNLLKALPGSPALRQLFIAGILILLLAMFIPFRWGMDAVFYKIPFLNQFRSLGRFAWAFYFIFTIYYSYGFWMLLRKISMKKGRVAFALCAGILFLAWFSDLHFSLQGARASIGAYGGNNVLVENERIADLLKTSGYTPADFQAALPYPIPADGSEKLWFSGDWLTKWSSLSYSYQTGAPVLGCIMSRTSISRTLNLISLAGSDYSEKKIVQDFPSRLPILVIAPAQVDTVSPLIKRCREIARKEEMILYILAIDSLEKKPFFGNHFANSVRQNFIQTGNYYASAKADKVFYWTNENMAHDFSGSDEKLNLLEKQKFEMKNLDSSSYLMSCWIKVTPFGNKVPYFSIIEYDAVGKNISEQSIRADKVDQLDVHGDWVRFEYLIIPNPAAQKMEIEIKGKKTIIDHFLLKPLDVRVVVFPEKLPGKALYDNFLADISPGF